MLSQCPTVPRDAIVWDDGTAWDNHFQGVSGGGGVGGSVGGGVAGMVEPGAVGGAEAAHHGVPEGVVAG